MLQNPPCISGLILLVVMYFKLEMGAQTLSVLDLLDFKIFKLVPVWCQSLKHHQFCIAEIGRPNLALFLIPLVKMLLLVIRTKMSDRIFDWDKIGGVIKFKVNMDFAGGPLITK